MKTLLARSFPASLALLVLITISIQSGQKLDKSKLKKNDNFSVDLCKKVHVFSMDIDWSVTREQMEAYCRKNSLSYTDDMLTGNKRDVVMVKMKQTSNLVTEKDKLEILGIKIIDPYLTVDLIFIGGKLQEIYHYCSIPNLANLKPEYQEIKDNFKKMFIGNLEKTAKFQKNEKETLFYQKDCGKAITLAKINDREYSIFKIQ